MAAFEYRQAEQIRDSFARHGVRFDHAAAPGYVSNASR
jgi:hypothetical protein